LVLCTNGPLTVERKAVEIDAYPDRQDLNLSLLKIAKRCGTRISLGTDAHIRGN